MGEQIKHRSISIMTSVYGGKKVWFIGQRTWTQPNSISFRQISDNFNSYQKAKQYYELLIKQLKTTLNKTKEI